MNVVNVQSRSVLSSNILFLVSNPSHYSIASDKGWGKRPWVRVATLRTGSGKTAVQSIPDGKC